MSNEYNLSTKHAVDEVVEHIILEKTNLLNEGHTHFLPKNKETKAKSSAPSASFRFLLVGYAIIAFELWVLYNGLVHWNLA